MEQLAPSRERTTGRTLNAEARDDAEKDLVDHFEFLGVRFIAKRPTKETFRVPTRVRAASLTAGTLSAQRTLLKTNSSKGLHFDVQGIYEVASRLFLRR